jgi:glutaredoxin-like protein NrdH
MNLVKVAGKNKRHKVLLYTLSTCGHCTAAKRFFRDIDAEFEYIDVDLCDQKDKQEIQRDILKRGSDFAFPKIIIDNNILITGFDKERIEKTIEI